MNSSTMTNLIRTSLLLVALTLSACTSEQVSFSAKFGPNIESNRKTELSQTITRVIQRRMESMEGEAQEIKTTLTDNGADVSFTASPGKLAAPITDQLVAPFTFRLMRAAKANEKADITFEETGGYVELGVTEADVLWLTGGTDENTKKGWVEILFTVEGRKKVKDALVTSKGSQVALIVRNQLVSTFQSQGVGRENIFIDGVPTPELAGIFADDVNVGVHVTFTPKK